MAAMCQYTFAQVPVIASFTPASGPTGTPVIITGANFSATAANNTVYFGAVKAVVQTASTTSLTAIVPVGATFQPISVTVNNLIAYATRPFIVTYTGGGMSFTSTSFAPPTNLTGDAYVTAADLDGDQRTDLIYAGASTNKITIHRNTTTGSGPLSFTPTDLSGFTVPIGVKAGDINGDGLLDLVVSCPSLFKLYILKNTSTPGNISFSNVLNLNTVTEPRKIAIGDLDNDGKADIAATLASTLGICVFKNITSGGTINFGPKTDFTVTSSSEGIAMGDLTEDGKPDIITAASAANGISVLVNTSTPGTISFSARLHFFTDGAPWEVAIADVDGDGKADMMSSNNATNNISVFRCTGSNPLTFDKVTLSTSADPRGLELNDLNADGKPDIVSSTSSSDSAFCILKNTSTPGAITFEPFVKYGPNPGLGSVALADLNNDGLTDITIGKLQSSALSIFLNQLNINTSLPQCPVKPLLSQINDTSFCEGSSVNLVSSLNSNNQWFVNNTIINGATGISYNATTSGNYFVRVMNTSSSCYNYSDTVGITVRPVPATPTITVTGNATFCVGDSVKLQSPAATSYQWFIGGTTISGATNQLYFAKSTGTFTVKTTNATNCISAASTGIAVTVIATAAPAITGASGFCTGDSLLMHASSASTIQWYKNHVAIPGATSQDYYAKDAGPYTITTTQTGCKSPESSALSPTVFALPAKPSITSGGTSVSTTAGFVSYVWYRDNVILPGATANSYNTTQNGIYKVTVGDINGCKNTSDNFNYVTTGINDVYFQGYTIQLYPNPVINELTIKVEQTLSGNGHVSMAITDVTGKRVHSQTLKQGNNTVYFKHLAPGVYMVLLKNGRSEKTIKILRVP